jgi:hypothetical protein
MIAPKSARNLISVLSLTLLLLASFACGGTGPKDSPDVPEPAPVESSTDGQVAVESETDVESLDKENPDDSSGSDAADAQAPNPGGIRIVDQGFGQHEEYIGIAFLVENSNPGSAVEGTRYQIEVFDDAGSVVADASGYVQLLLPNQTLGVASSTYVDEGVTAASIEVTLEEGTAVATEPLQPLQADSFYYHESELSTTATGMVSNPYDHELAPAFVAAVVYNDVGKIIGGAESTLNFIPANGSVGAQVFVTSSGDVARVELYPRAMNLVSLQGSEQPPAGASDIVLVDYGFGKQDEMQYAGIGVVVENPNAGYALWDAVYHVTVFDDDDHVLGTMTRGIKLLWPNQTLGVGEDILLGEGIRVGRMEVVLKNGRFVESEQMPPFTAENVTFDPNTTHKAVSGEIVNPYPEDVVKLMVSAIAYDAAGEITGGGYEFLDLVPANGKAEIKMSINDAGTTDSVELYAAVSALSDWE